MTKLAPESVRTSDPVIRSPAELLVKLFKLGLGYSAINTARSALSAIFKPRHRIKFGDEPFAGNVNRRPAASKYDSTWDTDSVKLS